VTGAGTDKSLRAFQTAFTDKSSPVLVLHGARDPTVDSRYAELLVSMLKKANVPHEFRLYPSAEHSFERGNLDSEAAADAWGRTLRFLNAALKMKQ
jgi:acetyl esterase/lipase